MDMCEYKEVIEECIVSAYSSPCEVDGKNLHELGEWIDIIKDIEEMRYYESETEKNEKIIESMNKGNIDSVVEDLSSIIESGMSTMSATKKAELKTRLQSIVSMM